MNKWLSDHELDEITIELINQTKKQREISETCNGEQACGKVGLTLRYGQLPFGTDGLLSGTQVVINQALIWRPRIEFTIFHEITHYLLNEDGRHYEHFTTALHNDERAFNRAIEHYCNRGAAEFLMPRHLVRAEIAAKGFSVALIEHLSSTLGASIVASAIQLASCAPVECYVLLCIYGPQPKSVPARTALHAEYVATPRITKYTLARYSAIPPDHLCYKVWQDQKPARGRSFVPFPSGKRMPCEAEALSLRDGRVACILSLGQLPSPGQMSFAFPDLETPAAAESSNENER